MKARENPFRVERLHALRYRFQHGDLETILQTLQSHGNRGAIVGPHGTGKTTLLSELAAELRRRGEDATFFRLSQASRPNSTKLVEAWLDVSNFHQFLVLDGAEQLGTLGWRKFAMQAVKFRGLVITTHQPGLLPTIHECRSTPTLLHELVGELTSAEAGTPCLELDTLHAKHRGNVRDCLRELYDRHL